MATVFLARTVEGMGVHRFVALKRIHAHLVAEPGFVEMFLDEGNVLSRIVHPNVCTVYDFGEEDGQYYIAMEYLMGEPLSRVAKAMKTHECGLDASRELALVTRIVADACEGLHAAHELRNANGRPLGVVHRDVSPQNLFLTYDGSVKVVDFGLVRTDQALHRTRTGIVKGKFAYLAPEALAKRPIDRRADIWALGVVLWELLTGDRLFWRSTEMDTLMAVTAGDIPPPSSVRPEIPPALDSIVARALARDPDERFATARELGQELLRFSHRCPEPIGLPDLADFMDRLFPNGRIRKQELLEVADQISADEVATAIVPRPSGLLTGNTRAGRRASPARPPDATRAFSGEISLPSPKATRTRAPRVQPAPQPAPEPMPQRPMMGAGARGALSAIALLVSGGFIARIIGPGQPAPAAIPVAARPDPTAVPPVPAASEPAATPSPSSCPAGAGRYTLEVVPDNASAGDRMILQVRPVRGEDGTHTN